METTKLISQFLLDRKSRGRSKTTIKYYTLELKYFIQYLQSNHITTIDQITPFILRSWFDELGTHRKKSGVAGNYRTIRAFMFWVWNELDLDTRNPIKKVHIETPHNPPLPEIPLETVRRLLNACRDGYHPTRDNAILRVLVDTGARASELISLNIEDVSNDGSVFIRKGKGGKSRVVFLGKSSMKAVKLYLATRSDAPPSDPLFVSNRKTRLKFFGLREIVVRLCQRADVDYYGLHAFRRLFALTLYRKTKDIFLVSKLLGHSEIQVTLRYLNVGNFDLREIHHSNSPADMLD